MTRASLRCIEPGCGRVHALAWPQPKCEACGGLLEVAYDFDRIEPCELRGRWQKRRLSDAAIDRSGVWRFRELLPFLPAGALPVTLSEGGTPLVPAPRTALWAGGVRLAAKHLGGNPTGSFKDLGMTACITWAVTAGVSAVACASTGNTSASMAAYAARAGLAAIMFVPFQGIAAAKLAQALEFGARVVEVRGSFDDAFRLLEAVSAERGLYVVNSINPFRLEGQKTAVVELLDQRAWVAPDFLVLPGGNLGNVSAMGKALRELRELDVLERVPRLVVVQAAKAAPFHRHWISRQPLQAVEHPETEATAIRIGHPANWPKADRELQWTDGLVETVTDAEIEQAKTALAADGIGCEPASAAAVAGLRKLCQSGRISPDADVVAVLTGHQLKDPDYILRRYARQEGTQRIVVDAGPEGVRRVLDALPV
ncbi:MAG TPA: threonine synthase [Candidatus Acidoferrales bacterium]|nr:threonine synthase [Candidatus Acidoferrales bacterium]